MLKKLVAGEYKVKTIFWLFGLIGFFIFNIFTNMTYNGALRAICGSRICFRSIVAYIMMNFVDIMTVKGNVMLPLIIHLLVSACFVCYMIIVLRGLWKSGDSYEGKKFWVLSAKFILVVVSLFCFKSLL